MYKEIHPFFYNSALSFSAVTHGQKKEEKDFYMECPARVIDLSTIKQLSPNDAFDGSIELTRLQISDDHTEDILVSKEEGEEIKKILLKSNDSGKDKLSHEISQLVTTIRNLTELLRFRLH